jgi:chromosome transmission fidelity protein 4
MSGKDLTKRFAHNNGFCSLAYAPSVKDRILVTCGNDDLVKLHNLELGPTEEGGIQEVDHFDDSVYAVAVSPDGLHIAAGGEGSVAVLFNVEDGGADYECNLTKTTLPIRDLSFSPDSSWLAVASDEDLVKVVNIKDVNEIKTFQGHEGGVKCVAFDPKGEYLASSGTDRSVRLWYLDSGLEIKKLSGAYEKVPATAVSDGNPVNLCQLAWAPNGEFLAVAGSKDVKILERGSLKQLEACAGAHEHEISIVQFSGNGQYLLSVDVENVVVVWDFNTRESLQRYQNGSKVLNAKWDPFSNSIALISAKGEYGLIDNVIPSTKPGPNDKTEDEDDAISDVAAEEDPEAGGVTWEGEGAFDGGFREVTRRVPPQPAFQPQVLFGQTRLHVACKQQIRILGLQATLRCVRVV